MPRWTPAPIVGGAYQDDARAFSVQDTVNWIPERAESDGTRSDGMLRDAPGAHVVCDLGTHAPIRGLHNCEGRLLAVSGTTLFEVAADYTASSRGSIPGVSRVSIAHNQITGGNEVLIANGQAGYVYNTVDETLAQVTDESYPGAICVDYLAQVLAQIEPQRRFWFHSDLTQATQYISTDEYEAESAPDLLVALIASHGQLLVLGDRTGEFYAATGGNTSFFERMEGTTMEVGCASPHAVVRLDSTVFWIGSDGKGYRLNGYNAQRITTHAIEQAWSRCDLKKAFAFTFEDRGHTIAYFNFPDGGTWGYDVATQQWHRRTSKGLDRWRINALVYWNGHWIGGDYSNGKLYRLDWDHKLECCEPLERQRVSGVLHDNQNEVGVNAAEFVFEAGGPASTVQDGDPPSISGSLPDGTVGDEVDYQYTITRAYPGQRVTLTVTGALPAGVSLDANGRATGTRSAAGTANWQILPAGECVTGVALADSSVTSGFDPNTEISKYLLITFADAIDRSAIGYDDSAWATGLLPLGTGTTNGAAGAAGFPATIATTWPLDKNAWFRATFEVATPTDLTLSVYLDDAAQVWINGVSVFNHTTDDLGGTTYLWSATITADKFVAGTNYIAIKCRADIHGISNYVSYRLLP